MKKGIYFYFLFLLFVFLLQADFCYAVNSDNEPIFFIGEDIVHPKGLIISVNEVNKKSVVGGFSNSVQKEDYFINLTLMNNGNSDLAVSLKEDFTLELGTHLYFPFKDQRSRFQTDEISIGASAQTRIDLTFRVNPEDSKGSPSLLFAFDGTMVRVICDKNLGKIVTENNFSDTSKEELVKIVKILIEANRLTAAKNICESALLSNPNDGSFLILMAKIYGSIFEKDQEYTYLNKIDVTKMVNSEDVEEVANLAISFGYSEVAMNILSAFNEAGLLNDRQKSLLARAYYYENELQSATRILNKLFESGYNDAKACFTMGNICNKEQDNENAIYYWEKAVELDPNYSEALYNIGVGYYKMGNIVKARLYWMKVIQSNPDYATLKAAKAAIKDIDY